MNKYIYDGPVMQFNTCIMSHWSAETMATSEAKAKNNFMYQFKTRYNKLPGSKIDLPGKIILIG